MNGIVIVDKPAGWTSQDVAARLRRVFDTRRIGHGGTLDPMATGVLPVFVGRATRGVEFFEHADKVYEAALLLGTVTDTQDITGTVLETNAAEVSNDMLEAALASFRGEILQIPPMYSALKVDGKKLYDLARAGKTVPREPRPVTIHALECLRRSENTVFLRIHCSKGTYIRTLCHDIGAFLGCGGCMASLRRTAAGGYTLADAVALETLLEKSQSGADMAGFLRPVDSLFAAHQAVTLTQKQEQRCRNGNRFSVPYPDGTYRAYSAAGEFLMLAQVQGGVMSTIKSFFEV